MITIYFIELYIVGRGSRACTRIGEDTFHTNKIGSDMAIDWPLSVAVSTAIFAGLGWAYGRFTFRGPQLSLENDLSKEDAPQRTVVMTFDRLPPSMRERFPEYSAGLHYALASLVWLNLGDRAGAVHIKDIRACADRHLESTWYSYVSVPPNSVHTEIILIRGIPPDGEIELTLEIDYEWLQIPWWRRGKRVLHVGTGMIKVIVTPPVVPLPIATGDPG